MIVIFALFLYYLGIKYFAKDNKKITLVKIGLIVTAIIVLTDASYIASKGFVSYFKSNGWQVLLAFIVYMIFVMFDKNFIRKNNFNRKSKRKIKTVINTNKLKVKYLIGITIIEIILFGLCLANMILDYYNISNVPLFALGAGIVFSIFTIVVLFKNSCEKFILVIDLNKSFSVYSKDISNVAKFDYSLCIGDLYRYYIIEKLPNIYFKTDKKEVHYVFYLKSENLDYFDINNLDMTKENDENYKEYIDKLKMKNRVKLVVK